MQETEFRLLKMDEVQAILGISRQTVYRWAWRGEIPTVKIGGRRYVPEPALADRLNYKNKK